MIKKLLTKLIKNPPNPRLNISSKENYATLRKCLENEENASVLFVGSGYKKGYGVECFGKKLLSKSVNLDLKPSGIVSVVGNAHSLPFKEEIFNAVVAQAVIPYLKNPFLAVNEIKRVLKKGGYVYVETHFIHRHDYSDFWRLTEKGILELFKDFTLISKGMTGGPSSAFTDILIRYLAILFSFNSKFLFSSLDTLFRWLLFPLKYLDIFLKKNKYGPIIAHGYYFLGKKMIS